MRRDKATDRLRINLPQIALLIAVGINVVALTITTAEISNGKSNGKSTFNNIKYSAESLALIQRETLAYTTRFAQWGAGDIPRRDVQLARSFLIQRLNVVLNVNKLKPNPTFLKDLALADKILSNSKPGYLSRSDYAAIKAQSGEFIDSMLTFSRAFAVTYRVQLDEQVDRVSKDYSQNADTNLRLLLLLLLLLSILISSLIYTLNRQYKVILSSIEIQMIALKISNEELQHSGDLVEKLEQLDERKLNVFQQMLAGRLVQY